MLREICHELRTPVAAIRALASHVAGPGQTGADGAARDEAARNEAAALLVAHADHLGQLLDAIAAVAEGRSGDLVVRDGPRPLEALIRAAADAAAVPRTRLRMTVPEDCWACSDGGALRQVLTNLLENACRHDPSGSVVEIRADRGPAHLRLTVADRGPGFPPVRTERALGDPRTPGAGMGLGIVRRLVRRLGGELAILPRTGGGTEVQVTLPA